MVWEYLHGHASGKSVVIDCWQIPKPNEHEGLGIGWPAATTDMDELKKLLTEIKAKM